MGKRISEGKKCHSVWGHSGARGHWGQTPTGLVACTARHGCPWLCTVYSQWPHAYPSFGCFCFSCVSRQENKEKIKCFVSPEWKEKVWCVGLQKPVTSHSPASSLHPLCATPNLYLNLGKKGIYITKHYSWPYCYSNLSQFTSILCLNPHI